MNLPLRVLLGYFLIVGLAAFFVLRIFVAEVRPSVKQAIEESMVDTANILAEMATDDLLAGTIANGRFAQRVAAYHTRVVDARIFHFHKTSLDYRVIVTDAKGIVRYDSEHRAEGMDYSNWQDIRRTLRGEYGARSTHIQINDKDSSVFYVAAPVRDGERIIGVLSVAKPESTLLPIIRHSENTIVRHGAWLLGGSALIGLAVTLWLTGSIRRLRNYARKIAAGEAAEPPTGGGQEISDLARAMEAMREKLEGKQYVERTVQALTHELKSPLAALRGAGEILAEPDLPEAERLRFARHVQSQSERLSECVARMLALSRLESTPRQDARMPCVLAQIVADLLAARQARADAKGIHFNYIDASDALLIHGEGENLGLALGNLLDNALDHAPAGSMIDVRIKRATTGLIVSVRDHGAGIPDYALPHLCERFYSLPRPDGSKGSGLGLAIVQEVARRHGGHFSLGNHPDGGALASLEIPDFTVPSHRAHRALT
jgi:two-component system sensor histidine kinase CreC